MSHLLNLLNLWPVLEGRFWFFCLLEDWMFLPRVIDYFSVEFGFWSKENPDSRAWGSSRSVLLLLFRKGPRNCVWWCCYLRQRRRIWVGISLVDVISWKWSANLPFGKILLYCSYFTEHCMNQFQSVGYLLYVGFFLLITSSVLFFFLTILICYMQALTVLVTFLKSDSV